MKKYFALSAVLLAMASPAFAQLKVGTVDMNSVFQGYYKTKDAESKINDARAAAKKELDTRMDEYKKLAADITKMNEDLVRPELSADGKSQKAKARDDKANEARSMEQEIREFQQTREKQLQETAVRMRNGIVEEINKLIQDKVKSENYDMVFDRSGSSLNGVPFLLFAKDNMDFSPSIISALNADKPATSSSSTSATPAATPKKK